LTPSIFRSRLCLLTRPIAALLLAALATGCGRPVGDFGRAEPGALHDEWMPSLGRTLARHRDEPVSDFRLTDKERELRDRSWHMIAPPHAEDWIGATKVELRRTRIWSDARTSADRTAYFRYLVAEPFRSSDARFTRIVEDMRADRELIHPFARLALAVERLDRERERALENRRHVSRRDVRNARARIAENRRRISWVRHALRFRLASYRYAIDKLELETPSDRLFAANRAYDKLKRASKDAWTAPSERTVFVAETRRPRRGRVHLWSSDDGRVRQK